jgi:hypothetical protein
MGITFRIVRIGELFTCNGNTYIKQSTRTAKMVSNGRVFYMGQMETCKV